MYAQTYAQYENGRISCWKDRVVRAASNLLDHDPPPTPPIREALTNTIERYSLLNTQIHSKEFSPVANYSQGHILVALAPSALHGLEKLRKRESLSDDLVNWQSWEFLCDNSENFTIKEV